MIIFEKQGQVVRAINTAHFPNPPEVTPKRGVIAGFSRRSRSRMIDTMMRLELSGVKVSFLTLTFAGCPEITAAKQAFKRFIMRLRRKHPGVSAVWRLEFQGRGAAHFHLMLFNCPFWPQRQLQDVWTECTGEVRSIVHIKLVSSHRQLINYVSKYIGKVDSPAEGASLENAPYQHELFPVWTGRIWGYVNKDGLPFGERTVLYTDNDDIAGYFWFAVRSLSRGKSGQWKFQAKLYTQEGDDIIDFLLQNGVLTENALHFHTLVKQDAEQWFGGQPVLRATSVPLSA